MNEDKISFENPTGNDIRYDLPSSLSVEDLVRNRTGIILVLSSLNSQAKRIRELTEEINIFKRVHTSLFESIVFAIVNFIGTIIVAVGVNMLTSDSPLFYAVAFIVFGGIVSIITLLIPIVRQWQAIKNF